MANVGDKYIIEIEQVMKDQINTLYRIKGFKSLVFDDYGLNMIEPYVSEEQCEDTKAFEQGMEVAWGLAKKIACSTKCGGINEGQMEEIFGQHWTVDTVMSQYSPQTIMKLITDYETRKDAAIVKVLKDIREKYNVSLEDIKEVLGEMI